MIKNYLRIALRNIFKHKGFSLINIVGLSIGMACSIIIFLWITHQLSFDQAQVNKQRIYRLEKGDWGVMPPIFEKFLTQLPEIEKIVRFYTRETPTLKYEDRSFDTEHFIFADNTVFDVFTLPFVQGSPKTAFYTPLSLVLTESTARKMFGNENPMGRIVKYDNAVDFTITGIIKDVERFQVEINALAPYDSLPLIKGQEYFYADRYSSNYITYFLVPANTDIPFLTGKINETLKKTGIPLGDKEDFTLRPFTDIYFGTALKHETGIKHADIQLIILFSAIALFILIIACINFINLTTARSSLRRKEISVRKVVGAHQKKLMVQFFSESLVIVFISLIAALVLIKFFLPVFNRLAGEQVVIEFSVRLLVGMFVIFLFTGTAAGLFPSFYLASLSPFALIKGSGTTSSKGGLMRKILIIFQFSISVFLVIGTITVLKQINFMENKDLGIPLDKIIHVKLREALPDEKQEVLRQRFLQHPGILKVSFSSQVPGKITNTNTWKIRGLDKSMKVINTDPDYIEVMELKLAQGRNFSWDMPTDVVKKYVINEEAARYLGVDAPLGQIVTANFGASEIIGVVKDYHFNSLHNKIAPLAICWYTRWATEINIKTSGSDLARTVKHIQDVWSEMFPGFPANYSFLDESFSQQYKMEKRLAQILEIFVLLAILLACLGLYGLSAFIAEQKTREIGIRKALGSSITGIVLLLSKDFSRWVLVSNLFAWPAAYFILEKWLQNFAYRTDMGIGVFVFSALIALLVAQLTVSFHSIKAAAANPVEALKYE